MRFILALLLIITSLATGALAQTSVEDLTGDEKAPVTMDTMGGETIAAGRDIPSDSAIANRISGIFAEIDALKTVRVSVRSGVVLLQGALPDQFAIDQAEALATRVEGVVTVSNQLQEETSVTERIVPVMERLSTRLLQALNYIPLLTVAVLVFAIVGIFGWWLAARRWPFERIAPNAFISDLLRQILRLVFLGLGLVLALDILGASAVIGTVLGAAGIVGLAVGFAVRDTVENYIASILLSLRQPFRPKDYVEIDGHEGHVIMLTSRATVLLSLDGNHIRIPNATVFKSVITNYTRHPERMFTVDMGIAPHGDLQKAVDIGHDVLKDLDFILKKPQPESRIEELGDSTVQLRYAGWVDQRETSMPLARGQAIRLIMRALENAGFELPEPGYRVTLTDAKSAPSAKPAASAKKKLPPVKEADISADEGIAEIVEEERAQLGDQDLLKEDAPQEMG
ncbi:mechanosensitive ion channel family protein [Pararhizobium sp. IMCC21322]|uniref:mechanosensitive ion channel family protein n=1 Tax=Pararhizobium sp. IMCC21322 TaxID=3067903 RepID=UPI0027411549|nr:mechanosensitive ion channel family protein [Pararhizobium sp. IMCC21322]